MQSILQKLRVITLSNVHTLLNAIKNLNSIGEFEQYIRDLETSRDMLDDQAASSRSDVQTLPLEIATKLANCEEANKNIDILLGDNDPTNDHHAAPLEAELMSLEEQIKLKQNQLENAQAELEKYQQAVAKLDLTLAAAKGKLEVLRELDKTAKGKDRAEKALSGIAISEMPDMDDVERRLRQKAAVSDNALDRELKRVSDSTGGGTLEANVAARLAARRAKIKSN